MFDNPDADEMRRKNLYATAMREAEQKGFSAGYASATAAATAREGALRDQVNALRYARYQEAGCTHPFHEGPKITTCEHCSMPGE